MTKNDLFLKSIQLFPDQVNESFKEALKIKLPANYQKISKIAVGGMGGSQLGMDLITAWFGDSLTKPILQTRDYLWPKYVDHNTLAILISYSGNTEEVLSLAAEAKKRQVKVIVIAGGGALESMAKKHDWPNYIFDGKLNPSNQPRMGTGYLLGAALAFLRNLKLINLKEKQILEIIKSSRRTFSRATSGNSLDKISQKLGDKIPVIIAAEFFGGNAHLLANQLNESAKQTAVYFQLPEINHHLLEGLKYPIKAKKLWHFVFCESSLFRGKNLLRLKITKKVLKKQGIGYSELKFKGTKLEQAASLAVFGSLLSYHLALKHQVDPNKIPWVDYFKNELKKA